MSENEKQASVPFFVHEATMNKMDVNNKRMLVALITVCITLIITVCCFLTAYRSMNNSWMTFVEKQQEVTADAGVYEQSDPGSD